MYKSEKKNQCYIIKCDCNHTKTICTEKGKPKRKYTKILIKSALDGKLQQNLSFSFYSLNYLKPIRYSLFAYTKCIHTFKVKKLPLQNPIFNHLEMTKDNLQHRQLNIIINILVNPKDFSILQLFLLQCYFKQKTFHFCMFHIHRFNQPQNENCIFNPWLGV